ncbi:hypothetical protein CCACVL1_20736 [Corchorus capsularis]|uniref:Uncharacterized protein n=1 Tax=Corchorus capsularis TaxID=210143 RepID=A0A1R3HA32_COCAP|nr:hypothetical protein CCACVL1_20736 [Corchorus capsularis]
MTCLLKCRAHPPSGQGFRTPRVGAVGSPLASSCVPFYSLIKSQPSQ